MIDKLSVNVFHGDKFIKEDKLPLQRSHEDVFALQHRSYLEAALLWPGPASRQNILEVVRWGTCGVEGRRENKRAVDWVLMRSRSGAKRKREKLWLDISPLPAHYWDLMSG